MGHARVRAALRARDEDRRDGGASHHDLDTGVRCHVVPEALPLGYGIAPDRGGENGGGEQSGGAEAVAGEHGSFLGRPLINKHATSAAPQSAPRSFMPASFFHRSSILGPVEWCTSDPPWD